MVPCLQRAMFINFQQYFIGQMICNLKQQSKLVKELKYLLVSIFIDIQQLRYFHIKKLISLISFSKKFEINSLKIIQVNLIVFLIFEHNLKREDILRNGRVEISIIFSILCLSIFLLDERIMILLSTLLCHGLLLIMIQKIVKLINSF